MAAVVRLFSHRSIFRALLLPLPGTQLLKVEGLAVVAARLWASSVERRHARTRQLSCRNVHNLLNAQGRASQPDRYARAHSPIEVFFARSCFLFPALNCFKFEV